MSASNFKRVERATFEYRRDDDGLTVGVDFGNRVERFRIEKYELRLLEFTFFSWGRKLVSFMSGGAAYGFEPNVMAWRYPAEMESRMFSPLDRLLLGPAMRREDGEADQVHM